MRPQAELGEGVPPSYTVKFIKIHVTTLASIFNNKDIKILNKTCIQLFPKEIDKKKMPLSHYHQILNKMLKFKISQKVMFLLSGEEGALGVKSDSKHLLSLVLIGQN